MLVAPVERPVASAAYGFVRFIGGGLAPYRARNLAAGFNVHVPFYLAAGVVLAAIAVLATGHSVLTRAERDAAAELGAPARAPAGQLIASSESTATPQENSDNGSIVAAVSATADAASVTATAIEFAELLGCPVEIPHVVETGIAGGTRRRRRDSRRGQKPRRRPRALPVRPGTDLIMAARSELRPAPLRWR